MLKIYPKKIIEVLGGGSLDSPKGNYKNLYLQDIPTLYKVAVIINGKMRTPKIYAHHLLVDWFNINRPNLNLFINKLDLDTSPLSNNAWLSGFLEADSNFLGCNFNLNSSGTYYARNIKYYMRISLKKEIIIRIYLWKI